MRSSSPPATPRSSRSLSRKPDSEHVPAFQQKAAAFGEIVFIAVPYAALPAGGP